MASRNTLDEDLQRILEESNDSSNDSDSDSDSGSSVVDDIALADVVMNEADSEDEDRKNEDFHWERMENFIGQLEVFSEDCGPQNRAKNVVDIAECFELFFDKDFITIIVEETNRYAEQYKNMRGSIFSLRSHMRSWQPVTESDIYVVLGIFILMGIVQKPTLRSYFSKRRVISTPGFADVISRDKFELICRFLHFTDNEKKASYEGPPKLFKIFPVLSHLNNKFQTLYLPEKNIAVDESLTLWKGRLSFRQYLPLKSSKFGIKTFELCESDSGYLWNFLVYTGKDTVIETPFMKPATSKTTAIVLKLVEPLLGKGYTVWMDNFYNSPSLARILKNHSTDCVGTMKINRKYVPVVVKEKKLKKGEIIARHAGPISVIKWCDKKVVTMISTYHNDDKKLVSSRGKEIEKPVCVIDYNKYMGGIDLKDQMLQMYLIERKRMAKWYMKLFKRLLNSSVLNSLIIYSKNTGEKVSHLSYRILLVEGLFAKYAIRGAENVHGRQSTDNAVTILKERHFIEKVQPKGKKLRLQRRCVVCSKHGKKKDTVYCCRECDVGLCLEECIKNYHTKLNY